MITELRVNGWMQIWVSPSLLIVDCSEERSITIDVKVGQVHGELNVGDILLASLISEEIVALISTWWILRVKLHNDCHA